MVLALLGSAAVATVIALALSRSILEPIRAVTRAARAMARGDLDQVVPGRRPATSWASWPTRSTRWPARIREFRQAGTARLAAGPEDGAGDDRLVPRPGGRRRPDRRGRAGQPGGPAHPGRRRRRTASIPWVAAAAAPAAAGRGARRPARLPADRPGPRRLLPRRRPGAVLPAPRPGDPRRRRGPARRRRGALRT